MVQVPPRPACRVRLIDSAEDDGIPSLQGHVDELQRSDETLTLHWTPIGACLAHFECKTWLHVMRQLIIHPERNSSNILRADLLSESSSSSSGNSLSDAAYGVETTIWRKLLPRRPNLDSDLLQKCSISADNKYDNALVVYTPMTSQGPPYEPTQIPFYHPRIRAIAFRYCSRESSESKVTTGEEEVLGDLYLYIVPFAGDSRFNAAKSPSHRLSRTTLALMETQALHSWGHRHNYQKRVIHDTLVPRDDYLDLYLRLKDKYAKLIMHNWVEKTDAAKHVFEDIGIAAFLILLWEETYKMSGERMTSFVDIGCGNGLLVHLLNAEGYTGFGFDLQERKSWSSWRGLSGGADLRIYSLDAPGMVRNSSDLLPPGCFLIGNHADELTSWLPFLAHSVPDCYGFANIPCCLFLLDGERFGNVKHVVGEDELSSLLARSVNSEAYQCNLEALDRGPLVEDKTASSTRNVAYLRYSSHLHLQAGWHLEKEALRIPSTKNWALIGRRRVWQAYPRCSQDHLTDEESFKLQADVEDRISSLTASNESNWKARLPPPGKSAARSSH